MADTATRVKFLQNIHLFRGVKDGDLAVIAEKMQEVSFELDEEVFLQGTRSDAMYLILKGSVTVTQKNKKSEKKLATLVPGDYFGEEGMVTGAPRNATVTAGKGTVLLRLDATQYRLLVKKHAALRDHFEVVMASRKIARQQKFKWMGDDEVIYFATRKHGFTLAVMLAKPLGLGLLGLVIMAFSALMPTPYLPLLVGGLVLAAAVLWMFWNYLDWENDFYVVTNRRVVRIEKLIGVHDSRHEAPLNTILSVGTSSPGWLYRYFDDGDVVVRTYTGQVKFEGIDHPTVAGAMVEEYWKRAQSVSRQQESDTIRQAIKNRIRPPKPTGSGAPAPKKEAPAPNNLYQGPLVMRSESEGVVTYHKHWIVLIGKWFKQAGSLLLLLIVMGALYAFGMIDTWMITLGITAFVILFLWMWYDYADWANDLYQVTPNEIVDIYRKPLAEENRKAAAIDNINSADYQRVGLVGIMFNYGTVNIQVGGANFDFTEVYDPPSVLQDITRRMNERRVQKTLNERKAEAERMADWLAIYHNMSDELREIDKPKPANTE